MDLSQAPRREPRESIVPMINVVFLLLIFFLMTAQIAPPEPFEVSPPESAAEEPAEAQAVLHVSAMGEMAYLEARDEAVFVALEGFGEAETLKVRADRAVPAEKIAALLGRLAVLGISKIELVSERR
ncbi:ExbD/TolR family protein [Aliiroseovarius sp.]|uniref:ExbD/TolR family protein n=1 Tax=Aliiroseovarius sp. TaxID=1872442 RepID=UPI003BAB0708